jgi:hypothetical protein
VGWLLISFYFMVPANATLPNWGKAPKAAIKRAGVSLYHKKASIAKGNDAAQEEFARRRILEENKHAQTEGNE